jgi:hypothetical protein
VKASAVCLALAAALLAGCGQKPRAQAPSAPAQVRGEPIRPARVNTPVAAGNISNVNNSTPSDSAVTIAATKSPEPAARRAEMAYAQAGFDKLSGYAIEISDEILGPVTNNAAEISAKTEALIPETVRAFNKKRVALKGFMLPLRVEGGLVTEFLIMKDQSMCCYGTVPKIHEWVSVKMADKGVKALMDQPVTLYGTLHVGEMRENGYLTGIYRLDGERMKVADE